MPQNTPENTHQLAKETCMWVTVSRSLLDTTFVTANSIPKETSCPAVCVIHEHCTYPNNDGRNERKRLLLEKNLNLSLV